MKKIHLNLITSVLVVIFMALFLYFSVNFQRDSTETMSWLSGMFKMNNYSKVAGAGIVITVLVYLLTKGKVKPKE